MLKIAKITQLIALICLSFAVLLNLPGAAAAQPAEEERPVRGLLGGLQENPFAPGTEQDSRPVDEPQVPRTTNQKRADEPDTAAGDRARRAAQPPLFADLAADPRLKWEGTYRLEYKIGGRTEQFLLTLERGRQYPCMTTQTGCHIAFQRDLSDQWRYISFNLNDGSRGPANSARFEFAADGTLNFQRNYTIRLPDGSTPYASFSFKPVGDKGFAGTIDWGRSEEAQRPARLVRLKPQVMGVSAVLIGRHLDRGLANDPTWGPTNPIENGVAFPASRSRNQLVQFPIKAPFYSQSVLDQQFSPDGPFNMRGSRPQIALRLIGRNLSGPTWPGQSMRTGTNDFWIDASAGMELRPSANVWRRRTDGLEELDVVITLWPSLKPGTKVLYFNGQQIPFVIDFDPPEEDEREVPTLKSLVAIDLEGKTLRRLPEGASFRLRAEFDGKHPDSVLSAVLPEQREATGGERLVPLHRLNDGRAFQSGVFRVEQASSDLRSDLMKAVGRRAYDPQKTIALIAETMAGNWDVQHTATAGEAKSGQAKVSSNGRRVIVALGEGWRAKLYESIDLHAQEREVSGKSYIRTRMVLEERPNLTAQYRSDADLAPLGRGSLIAIARSTNALEARLENKSVSVPIKWRPDPDKLELIRLQLTSDGSDRFFKGPWFEEEGDGLSRVGEQTWSRDPVVIKKAVVMEDQSGLLYQKRVADANLEGKPAPPRPVLYTYPFKKDGTRTDGSVNRTIAIVGENLPDEINAGIEGFDPSISYRTKKLSEGERGMAKRLVEEAVGSPIGDADFVLIEARLKKGVEAGQKRLKLSGVELVWPLTFEDNVSVVSFMRPGMTNRQEATSTEFMASESIRLVAWPTAGGGGKNLPFDIGVQSRGTKTKIVGSLTVERNEQGFYVSQPILLSEDGSALQPPAEPDGLTVSVAPGDTVVAFPNSLSTLIAAPNPALARVVSPPSETSLWQKKLGIVANCNNDPAQERDAPNYALRESSTLSRTFLIPFRMTGNAPQGSRTRTVRILNGDHAALLILRDEMGDAMGRLRAEFVQSQSSASRSTRYIRSLAENPGVLTSRFWTETVAVFVEGQRFEIQRREVSDIDALSRKIRRSRIETLDLAQQWMRDWTPEMLVEFDASLGRMVEANKCNIEELLVIAGQRTDPLFLAPILAKLVKQETSGEPPNTRTYWAPDREAHRFVRSVYVLGNEVRALDEYRKIDDAYKAMGVAAVTGVVAYGAGLVAGAEAAAATLLIGDGADLAYFGTKSVLDYLEGEEQYQQAATASKLISAEALADADGYRESGLLTAVGLIAPSLSGLKGLADLKNLRNIRQGRELVEAVAADGRQLYQLSQSERELVASAYSDLIEKASRDGVDSLQPADQLILNQVDDLIRGSGGQPAELSALRSGDVDAAGSVGTVAPPFPRLARPDTLPPPLVADTWLDPFAQPGLVVDETANASRLRSIADAQPGVQPGPSQNVLPARMQDEAGIDLPLDVTPLGQGSFNTVYAIDEELVARVPFGKGGESPAAVMAADRNGRRLFTSAFSAKADPDAPVRIAELRGDIELREAWEGVPGNNMARPPKLGAGTKIEVLERLDNPTLKAAATDRNAKALSMTAEEAIAYDQGIRALNKKGLVCLDCKHDNFGFEPHPKQPGRLRLVIMDTGAIVPIRGRNGSVARQIQSEIDHPSEATLQALGKIGGVYRQAVRKEILLKDWGKDLDYAELGLRSVEEIQFNPLGVNAYPRASNLAPISDQDELTRRYAELRARAANDN
ncbi:MAG: hypothetical protein AAF830_06995 [Pseudomonadota bacterium]